MYRPSWEENNWVSFAADESGGGASDDVDVVTGGDTDGGSEPNWRDEVSDPDLRKVAERFNTIPDMVKSVSDLRQKLSTAINVPGEGASEEDVAKYRKAIGIPDSAEAYDLKVGLPEDYEFSEVDTAFQGKMASLMHEAGLSADAAKKLASGYNEMMVAMQQEAVVADAKFAEEAEAALKKEWGSDYQRNIEFSNRAAKEMFGDSFDEMRHIELKNGRFLFDHPSMAKGLAKIGQELSEDGPPRVSASDRQTLEEKVNELGQLKHKALNSGDRDAAMKYDKEQRELLERLG